MSLQPITVYGLGPGPNPWKVVMILEELNIPYIYKLVAIPDMKIEPFQSINPNGRVPAIEDPNTGIILWESGAILEYLVETYDKQQTISFAAGSKEYFQAKQWLHFQMSGQGLFFGQALYFTRFHPEKVQSAVDRYVKEVYRVSGVLNMVLEGKQYLVGGKYSYVDSAFVPWYGFVGLWEIDLEKEFPNVNTWLNRLQSRPAIAKALKQKAELSAKN